MANELAVRNGTNAIAAYGTNAELKILGDRMIQFFNVPEKDLVNDKLLPSIQSASLKAAQLALRFGLTPGLHMYIVKRGGIYQAEESLEAWKDAANKHSRIERFLFDVQFKAMTPDDVKAMTPPDSRYTPDDRGCWARVLRFDIAREYAKIGMQYEPEWVAGFWRKEAYEDKQWDDNKRRMVGTGKWIADTVPAQRRPEDVAQRRAHRSALKGAFSLIQLDDYTEAQRIQRVMAYMERESAPLELTSEIDGATFATATVTYEPDGDVLYMTPDKPKVVSVDAPRTVNQATGEVTYEAPAVVDNGNGHQPATNGNGNGKHFTVRYREAREAAEKSGKFSGPKHLDAAWAKKFKEYAAHEAANADTFLAAWSEYVNSHEVAEQAAQDVAQVIVGVQPMAA